MELNIINQTSDNTYLPYQQDLDYYFHKTIEVLNKQTNYSVSLIMVSPLKIKNINKKYRNIDKVTDVISFALLDEGEYFENGEDIEIGDIFLNLNRVKNQAFEFKHSYKRELCFLFVHGLLHLFGYDHMNKKDEKEMFALQDLILGDLK